MTEKSGNKSSKGGEEGSEEAVGVVPALHLVVRMGLNTFKIEK